MARKSSVRLRPPAGIYPPAPPRPAVDEAPRREAVLSDTEASTEGGFTARLARVAQEILVVTYWFDPATQPEPAPVTVRFSGHRVDAKGRLQPSDQFVHDETIEQVIPGSGPISLTAKIRGITPGEWLVNARVLGERTPARGRRGRRESEDAPPATGPSGPLARLWRRWAPPVGSDTPVNTCLEPFAHVPGIFPGLYTALVVLGMGVSLALQFLVIAIAHLKVDSAWLITLVSIAVGMIGAKGWYIVLHRHDHGMRRIEGWCIQGFVTAATGAALLLLVLLRVPVGVFLDATAPGLLVAMAVGRVGCFFAGCCGGPVTAARFGVWSSDQRVGARRIPTQLLELGLALLLGLGTLVGVLGHGPAGGAFFVGGLAAYTLGRQGILHLRAEPRKTRWGGQVTAVLAALILVAAIVWLVR